MTVTDQPIRTDYRLDAPKSGSRRHEAERVMTAVADYCASLSVGDRVPPHAELMQRFEASERFVLKALAELQRRGQIVRRHRAGTFIAKPPFAQHRFAGPLPQTKTIVAIARPDHSFFDYALEMLHDYATRNGYDLVCRPVREDDELIASSLSRSHPTGYIVFQRRLEPIAKELMANGNRVVLVGGLLAGAAAAVPTICGDGEAGSLVATRHLIACGHRRIAFASDDAQLLSTTRWKGFVRGCLETEREGFTVAYDALPAEFMSWRENPASAAAFFRAPEAPTAIVAWNDNVATLLLNVLQRAGLSVPGDVSIIGYDAMANSAYTNPPLTTVDHFVNQQLARAMEMITNGDLPLQPSITMTMPVLVERESVAPPRDSARALSQREGTR
jgi:LacI family transcriptional regulator